MKRRKRITPAQRKAAHAAFGAPRGPEERYVRQLRGIARAWAKAYEDTLRPHRDGGSDWEHDLDELDAQILKQIRLKVTPTAHNMAKAVRDHGFEAARDMLGIRYADLGMDAVIANIVDDNVLLVENAFRTYSAQVREIFGDPANLGMRWEGLAKQLQERADVSESRAELIARDQTLKTNGQIAQTRMQNAKVDAYTWSTSRDEVVRPDHAVLEGLEFSWADPPVVDSRTGRQEHPGQDYQCRCVAIPVLPEFDGI